MAEASYIDRRVPWPSFEAVEFASLTWVDWFSHRRSQAPIGNISHAETEERYFAMLDEADIAAWLKRNGIRPRRGEAIQTVGFSDSLSPSRV